MIEVKSDLYYQEILSMLNLYAKNIFIEFFSYNYTFFILV